MQRLAVGNLLLEPLVVTHAEAMFELLSEPGLYRYLDYPPPPSVEHLRDVYTRVEKRESPDRKQTWLHWIVSLADGAPLGYVQVTILEDKTASIGYVFASKHWGHGYATRAMQAVLNHSGPHYGITQFSATAEAENTRSIRVLERLGFRPATEAERHGRGLTADERLFFG